MVYASDGLTDDGITIGLGDGELFKEGKFDFSTSFRKGKMRMPIVTATAIVIKNDKSLESIQDQL